jgi:hypothetical protein
VVFGIIHTVLEIVIIKIEDVLGQGTVNVATAGDSSIGIVC